MLYLWAFAGLLSAAFLSLVLVTRFIVYLADANIKFEAPAWVRRLYELRFFLPAAIILFGFFVLVTTPYSVHYASPFDHWIASALSRYVPGPEGEEGNRLFTKDFFNEVGIAFIVSGLVALSIESLFHKREEARHERQMKEIAAEVFKSVLGKFAPDWLSTQVVDMYKTKLLRENFTVRYTFSGPPEKVEQLENHRLPDLDDILTVHVCISYRLRNLSDEPTITNIRHQFTPTVPLPDCYDGYTDLTITDSKGIPKKRWHKGGEDDCVSCPAPPPNDQYGWKWRKLKVTEGFTLAPKEAIGVVVNLEVIRWRNDHVTWITPVPADGLSVEAVVNDPRLNIHFTLEESHPRPFDKTPDSNKWDSSGELLPWEGFTLHWFPMPPP